MATLINGNGNPAIYAQQDADFYNGIMGPRTRILNVGSKMAATIEDANTIAIADGVIITKEGRRVQVDVGNVDEFIIPTGQAGTTRYYIIGYHLYTDGSANQLCETFVQLMASGSETITEDEFREGATEVYVSLYRIEQTGLTLNDPEALLTVGDSVSQIEDDIDDIEGDIAQINSDIPKMWDHINVLENEIEVSSSITEEYESGGQQVTDTYKTSLIQKFVDGLKTITFPITHAKAVWYDKHANETVYDKVDQLSSDLTEKSNALLVESKSIEIASGTYTQSTLNVAKAGYTALGVVGVAVSQYDWVPYIFKIDNNVLTYGFRSRTGTSTTGGYQRIDILYVAN